MTMWDQAEGTNQLKASFGVAAYTTVTGTTMRLGETTSTPTANTTPPTGSGYAPLACSWTAGTEQVSNATAEAWTNGSGASWPVTYLEVWDTSPARKIFGSWGGTLNVANGDILNVAAGAVVATES